MGAGFIRRYNYMPGVEELQAIEGVVIVDQRSPGGVQGASYGVVAVVGEAANMSSACTVDSSGVVVSRLTPQEVYGGADLMDKIGPFDSTLGVFGAEMGNLFVELRNKKFARLICQAVDLIRPLSTTQYAIRLWRQLPTNTSATSIVPISPVVGVKIPSGTEVRASSNRVKIAQDIIFTGSAPKSTGVDGTTEVSSFTSHLSPTVTIVRATGSFIKDGVAEGDIVVPGSLNAASASQNLVCAGAGSLRVVSVDDALTLTCQKLSGENFDDRVDWSAGSALAYRVHKGTDADTGGVHQLSEAGGYTVLARPLTATVSSATALAAYPTPTAASGSYWGATSGLAGVTHPSGALTYDANVHAANLATTSLLRARYLEAIDALGHDDTPTNVISTVTSARKDSLIQAKLRDHTLVCSSRGLTRNAVISPSLATVSKATVLGSSAPGVGGSGGAGRLDRIFYSWPGCRTFIPEAVGTVLACADGTTTDDGVLDTTFDTWLAALLSVLPPENNPGQAADPVTSAFSPVLAYQRGCPTLDMSDYILFKQYGIAALRMDRDVGPIIQSGITTSLDTSELNINRRRFADFVQDSLAARCNRMAKLVARQSIKDSLLSEHEAFFGDLLSEGNSEAQRIESYSLDDKSANTPSLSSKGIHIIISKVRMLATLDEIVLQTEIGPSTITVSAI